MEAENKPQLDLEAFSRIMSAATGSEPEPAPGPDPVHLSAPPDPEPSEDIDDGGAAAAVADEAERADDPYRKFADAAGSEAADALRELHQSRDQPTTDDVANLVRHVYGKQYSGLSDNTTVAEVIVEAGGIADALKAAGDDAPDMDISQILDLAVKNVLDPRTADDEALGHILDGQKHLIATQTRDRDAHAKARRAKALEMLEANTRKKETSEGDQILEAILDGDHVRISTLTGGRGVGESHRGTGTGRNLGMLGT